MTKTSESTNLGENDASVINKKSDIGQHFLRAARAGNIQKIVVLINEHNADVHTCNANGLNALHLASKEGHADVVRELIERGAKPNTATKKGNTALHIASLAGQFEVVKLLLEAGAEVNVQAQNGFTPLYMAAQENHLEVVRLLLANGANPGLTTDDGFTPLAVALQQGHDRVVALLLESDSRGKVCLPALHIASKKDDIKAANLLLNSDVNVDHQSASGFTPLHIAAHYGNVNMTELLISRGANINFQAKNNITPLHVASKWGNQGVAERLITAGAELDCRTRDGLTPLHCAARSGHDTVVHLLLSAGANISAKTRSGLNSLHMAAQGDHVDTARLLLQHGAQPDDPTIDYLTALHVAAHCGNVRVAKLLLERACDVNARALNGFTPLHIACQKNKIKIVELLLKYNCLIQATTESGLTPLHVACFMGYLNIVVLLLQHGANANAPTVRCETSLHLATRAGQTDVARLLLRNGAQVDVKARGNQTPLHIASRMGNLELVILLLEHAANVQSSTKDTYTPLHLAAKGNHKEICELLLKNGAELEVATKSGFTPLHLAVKHSHLETARYLLLSGANMNAVGRNGLTPLHLATHYGSLPMVELLLEHKASPISQAKNGFIPLHIAAEKHLLDIGRLLIEATGDQNNNNASDCCSIQSRNGFTPLHLACQDGNEKMTKLLIDSGSEVNALAKNGLTAMHLAAQEDSVKAAELLFAAGSELDVKTKAGYTPLHTACHFGQVNMVRFLVGKGADVNAVTCMGSNALHLAAQQGHSTVIYVLLESGANPNMRNKYGWTPAHVARHQHYLNIFEALRQVTTCIESWEHENTEDFPINASDLASSGSDYTSMSKQQHVSSTNRHGLEHPDMMRDNPITDTEEECMEPDFTIMPSSPLFSRAQSRQSLAQQLHMQHHQQQQAYHQYKSDYNKHSDENYGHRSGGGNHVKMALDKMSNVSGEDSIHEGTNTENAHAVNWRDGHMNNGTREVGLCETRISRDFAELGMAGASSLTGFSGLVEWDFTPDNVPISRRPVASGFLVSFLVDARGGSMRGSRHPGLRILVPPSAASAPTRITCRMLRPERTARPPQLNDCEGLACRIIELGPHPCRFNSPVLLEIPHFAALRGRQRELVVLRSDNAETWREHSLEATDQAVQSAVGQSFNALETMEELREKRIIRILTNDFPQYMAVVSRIRQESSLVGSDGGVLSSTVVPQVQAVFPEGALQKRIRVGLQAQPIAPELVTRLFGNRVTVSPIVTLEPRRRKFHKPITLTIPLPKAIVRGMLNPSASDLKSQNVPSLRLLCSITGGTAPAQWEDITGSTPLSKVKDCVSFTTTVSARFWLMDCLTVHEAAELASMLYAEATLVPYMGKFVVFTKRLDTDEALVRCFCVTDDKVDKTLECQEGFELCAASPEVEVIESRPAWLEAAGNLLPVAKISEQLRLHFNAFRENRLAFPVRVKDVQQEAIGKLAFMREPRQPIRDGDGDSQYIYHEITPSQKPLCTLEVRLSSDNGMGGGTGGQQGLDLSLIGLENHPEFLDQLNETSAAELTMGSLSCVFPYPAKRVNEQVFNGQNNDESNKPAGNWASSYTSDVIARSQIDLIHVASEIGSDWPKLIEVLLPQSNLKSSCTVNQLVNWINESEPKWQMERNRLAVEMGKITGEEEGGNVAGSFGGPISVHELRTIQDQALAVLLAWREENGDSATGNELDHALRRIGREDVIKSCMREIRYVLDADEHAKATRQIDERKRSDPVNLGLSEPFSTSLVATTTLMSGMNDFISKSPTDADHFMNDFSEMDAQKRPNVMVTSVPDESELVTQSHLGAVDSQYPRKSDEVTGGSDGACDVEEDDRNTLAAVQGQTELEEDIEEVWQQQTGIEPACSTSQHGGDPMVMQKHEKLIIQEEADIIRDSESMSSSELLASGIQGSQQEIYETDEKITGTLKQESEVEDAFQSQQPESYHKELLSPTEIPEQHSTATTLSVSVDNDNSKELINNNTNTNDINSTRSQPTSEHCWEQEDELSDIVLQNETDKIAETDVQYSHDEDQSNAVTTIDHSSPNSEIIDDNINEQLQSEAAVISNYDETNDTTAIRHAHHVGDTSTQPLDSVHNLEAYNVHTENVNNDDPNISTNAHHGLESIPHDENTVA
ncbi:Ankyrin-2 isoform 1 [Schistosoma japonicum]|uniref:Ankyrin-2 isoform 1 n=1 Tax=Schistosoma japonicum TaxID=6182 RepID=A0A4Z2CVV7_SCHJA|nr:Ankyrin-2 isoform 1 [Schistosoma japonicum]